MRTWSYGINGHPDWSFGTIHLEDRPWWVAFVECDASAIPRRLQKNQE